MHKVIITYVALIFIANIGIPMFLGHMGEDFFIRILMTVDAVFLFLSPVIWLFYIRDKKKRPWVYDRINVWAAKKKIEQDVNVAEQSPGKIYPLIKKNYFYKLLIVGGIALIVLGVFEIYQYIQTKDINHIKRGLSFIFLPAILIASIFKATQPKPSARQSTHNEPVKSAEPITIPTINEQFKGGLVLAVKVLTFILVVSVLYLAAIIMLGIGLDL